MNENGAYPRPLTPREREWVDWLLPGDRSGYQTFRSLLEKMVVIGEGRRGKGNIVLGYHGDKPDTGSPLPQVFAYGIIEAEEGTFAITIREETGDQIDVEFVNLKGEETPQTITEKRRWSYSYWLPGNACPSCLKSVREISITSQSGDKAVLAICPSDKRLWIFNPLTGVNYLIPITNFYNELMLHKQIRQPNIALDTSYFFSHLSEFSDEDLVYSFAVYNKIRKKVEIAGLEVLRAKRKKGITRFLEKIFHS